MYAKILLNNTKAIMLVAGLIATVGASLITGTVVFAAVDYVETGEECSAGQDLSSFITSGSGAIDAWTILDNGSTHGWMGDVCSDEDGTCYWFYSSGNPSSSRSVISHSTWSPTSVFITFFQCYD